MIFHFIAVYADTKILPLIWVPSALETMKERFDEQKRNPGYKVCDLFISVFLYYIYKNILYILHIWDYVKITEFYYRIRVELKHTKPAGLHFYFLDIYI